MANKEDKEKKRSMYTLELSPEQMDKLQDLIESGQLGQWDHYSVAIHSSPTKGKTQCRRLQKWEASRLWKTHRRICSNDPRTTNHWRSATRLR